MSSDFSIIAASLYCTILQLEIPAQSPCLLHIAMCSALCNESVIRYNPDKRAYEKIGESTEVALRVLAEKVSIDLRFRELALSCQYICSDSCEE